ncbi:hypothetical protein ACFE04_001560 [Oxalis oulophora]
MFILPKILSTVDIIPKNPNMCTNAFDTEQLLDCAIKLKAGQSYQTKTTTATYEAHEANLEIFPPQPNNGNGAGDSSDGSSGNQPVLVPEQVMKNMEEILKATLEEK